MIEKMLDQLGEWEAQAALLEMDKRRLLDEVKIPDEVLAAQDEANKKRQKIDGEFWAKQKAEQAKYQAMLDAVVDPEMPPEFVAALAAARKKRDEISAQAARARELDQEDLNAAKEQIDFDLQAKVADVYKQVEIRKQEISAEFSDKASGVLDNIAKLTVQIKAETKKLGKTVKGQFYQAVYVRGRVSWNNDMLDGMIAVIPQLAKARKEGEPSCTIRKI